MTYPAIHIRVFKVYAETPSPELLESLTCRKAIETAEALWIDDLQDWGIDLDRMDFARPETLSNEFFNAMDDRDQRHQDEMKIIDAAALRMLSAMREKRNNVRVEPSVGYVILPSRYLVHASGYEECGAAEQAEHFALTSLKLIQDNPAEADITLKGTATEDEQPIATLFTLSAYKNGQEVHLGFYGDKFYTINRLSRDILIPADPGALPGVDDTSINPAKQPALKNTAYMGFTQRKPGTEPSAP
jgi:hypothetical protein